MAAIEKQTGGTEGAAGDRPPLATPLDYLELLGPPDEHRYAALWALARGHLHYRPSLELSTVVTSWRRVDGQQLHEVEVHVWAGVGRRRRLILSHVGCGSTLEQAAWEARYFALRRLLFGDVPVLGGLIDTPGVRLTLELTAEGLQAVLEFKGSARRDRRGLAQQLPSRVAIRAVLDRKGGKARTSYVRLTGIGKAIKRLYGGLINFNRTVRLHQLVAAVRAGAGGAPYAPGHHVHHLNGYGPDCRSENLVCVLPGEHVTQHRQFYEKPSQEGALRPEEPAALEVAELTVASQPARRRRKKIRHSREYGRFSYARAMREHRAGLRDEPRPLVENLRVIDVVSRRTDGRRSTLALLDLLWDADRPFDIQELSRTLSLSPSAVRKVVKRLRAHGLISTTFIGRKQWVEAATWPTPLHVPSELEKSR